MIIKCICALLLLAQVHTSCYAATTAENFDQSTTTELDRETFDLNDQTEDADDDDRDEAVDEQHSKAFLLEHQGKIGLSLAAIAATLGSIYCFTSTSTEDTKDAESKKSSRPKEQPNPVDKDKGKGLPAEGKNKKRQQINANEIQHVKINLIDGQHDFPVELRLKDETIYVCALNGVVLESTIKGGECRLVVLPFCLNQDSLKLIANRAIGNHSDVRYPIYLTGQVFRTSDIVTHLEVKVGAKGSGNFETHAFGVRDHKLYAVDQGKLVQDSVGHNVFSYLDTWLLKRHESMLNPLVELKKNSTGNPSDGYTSEEDPAIGDGSDSARTWLPLYHRDSKSKAKVSTNEPADNKVSSVLSNESTDNEVSFASVIKYSIEFGLEGEIYDYSLQDYNFHTYVELASEQGIARTEIKDESKVAQLTRLLPSIFLKAYGELQYAQVLKAIVERKEVSTSQQANAFLALYNMGSLDPGTKIKRIYTHTAQPMLLRLTLDLEGKIHRAAFDSALELWYPLKVSQSQKSLVVVCLQAEHGTLVELFPALAKAQS